MLSEKKCKDCEQVLPIDDFPKVGGKYRPRCKACQYIKYKAWLAPRVEERKDYFRKYHQENREKRLAYNASYYEENASSIRRKRRDVARIDKYDEKARKKLWRDRNSDYSSENSKRWREANVAHVKVYAQKWLQLNMHIAIERCARRRAAEARAATKWASLDKMRAIYAEARRVSKETGVLHHVDHIVPLRSKVVCGIHCEDNMQVLPAKENLMKWNKLTEDAGSSKPVGAQSFSDAAQINIECQKVMAEAGV